MIIFVAFCGVLVLANEEKQQVAEEKTSEQVQEEIQQEEADTSNDERVETISADINFNSWSELYDYIKELEEATTGQELEEGEDRGDTLRLELMTDGDALTLEGNDNNNNQQDEREGVVVHGTISDVIREVPAPDLSIKKEMLIGDEDVKAQEPDRPQIVATEADWTFIQDTLKKIDNQETILAKRAKDEAESMEEELTEEEKKGKEIFDKAKQMRASTRSNRKQAHNLYVEAAQHGYIPAKEKVAWFNLLSATTEEKLIEARKSFDELVPLGRSDSQMAMGFMFATGIGGLEASGAKALLYYTFGAVGGSTWAQMALAYRHWSGIGVSPSCEKALDFYRRVAAVVADELTLSGGTAVHRLRLNDEAENPGQSSGVLDSDLISYYQLQAEKGDVKAQLGLGQLHYQGGRGVEQDHQRALNYFLRAADAGDAHAMAFLGKMYLEGSEAVPQDNATAFKYFKQAAEHNNPVGQAGLGLMYLHGRHVDKDVDKAFQYFSSAAEKGWVDGHLQLGNMFLAGIGVRRDYKTAIKYFNLASQAGNTLAIYQLAQMHAAGTGMIRSCHTAVEFFKNVVERGRWADKLMEAYADYRDGHINEALIKYMLMADLGYEVAQSNAAFILDRKESDLFNVNETMVRALQYLSRAAAQGYAPARVRLGDYYYYGWGTEVDFSSAAVHYRIASDQLHSAQAMFNLGYMHEQGLGMKQDIHLAKRFYDMAAEASADAKVPVALALAKLSFMFGLRYLTESEWQDLTLSLDPATYLGPDWDLYLITTLLGLLVLVVYLRRPLQP